MVAINPLTSISVKYYEDIKGKYDVYKNHLASITDNGIWIREKIDNTTQIINAKALDGNELKIVSVYKFNEKKVLFERIQSKKAQISSTRWIMRDSTLTTFGEENLEEKFETLIFYSNYDAEKLNSIYSNLDTISFYRLLTNSKELIDRGYNKDLLIEKKHFYLSLPFFLILMVCLSGIFTLNSNDKKQNTYYIVLSIMVCAIIFFFKNFSAVLGTTERIPLLISVWSPVIILTLFCSVGVIQINDK